MLLMSALHHHSFYRMLVIFVMFVFLLVCDKLFQVRNTWHSASARAGALKHPTLMMKGVRHHNYFSILNNSCNTLYHAWRTFQKHFLPLCLLIPISHRMSALFFSG